MTGPEIGEVRRAKELGRKGYARYQWHACERCGHARWVQFNHLKAGRDLICKGCANRDRVEVMTSRNGGKALNWKGGEHYRAGYRFIRLDADHRFYCMTHQNGYIPEHRLVMATHLGRVLKKEEVVHHKNGNRLDNRLENLEILSSSEHKRKHTSGYQSGYEEGYAHGESQRVKDLQARVQDLEKEVSRLGGSQC